MIGSYQIMVTIQQLADWVPQAVVPWYAKLVPVPE
jgi:hypothetical protein